MENPPLSQEDLLLLCSRDEGFSLTSKHPYYANYSRKIAKMISRNEIRQTKRLGDGGAVYGKV